MQQATASPTITASATVSETATVTAGASISATATLTATAAATATLTATVTTTATVTPLTATPATITAGPPLAATATSPAPVSAASSTPTPEAVSTATSQPALTDPPPPEALPPADLALVTSTLLPLPLVTYQAPSATPGLLVVAHAPPDIPAKNTAPAWQTFLRRWGLVLVIAGLWAGLGLWLVVTQLLLRARIKHR